MTQWLDGSHIYGFSQSKSDELRERRGGRLRMFHLNHRELLPLDEEDSDCIGFDKGLRCFLAGLSFHVNSIGIYIIRLTEIVLIAPFDSIFFRVRQVTVDPTCK